MVWHGEDSFVRFTAKLEKDGKTVWTMLRIANGVQPFIDFVAVKPVPSRIQGAQAGPPPGQKDSEGCVDSPVIGRMAGGSINTCSHRAFDEAKFRISDDGETKIEGEVYDNEFNNDIQTSAYEIQRAYEVALKKLGYRIVYRSSESPEHLTAAFKKGDQETWVGIHNYNDNGNYRMVTVQTKAMAQQIEVNAASLLEDLRQNGHVAVYGIKFDFGKATITDDSVKVLDEIGKLLKDNADLKLRIEGHTDNVGKAHANLELSRKRATSVKDWLTHHGIDGSRLTIDGFGDTRPIEDNKTDEGRARNRRVELVKL
jgi:outer membrane protein OmpA-like peptidoglycan-associated protein